MKKKELKVGELTGYRNPEKNEIENISSYFEQVFRHTITVCRVAVVLSCIIAIIDITAYDSYGWLSVVIGVVALASALSAVRTAKRNKKSIQMLKEGNFQVLEGKVMEISANTEYPGVSNVRFQSVYGEVMKEWCAVRMEGLEIGTPLLLAYADENVVKKGISRAFTPYMLTEEGKKHYL